MKIIRNPSPKQFQNFISQTEFGTVKGIVSNSGEIFIADGDILHDKIARESGVEFYSGFIIYDLYENDTYSLCQDCMYFKLKFLHSFDVELPVSGLQRANSHVD